MEEEKDGEKTESTQKTTGMDLGKDTMDEDIIFLGMLPGNENAGARVVARRPCFTFAEFLTGSKFNN